MQNYHLNLSLKQFAIETTATTTTHDVQGIITFVPNDHLTIWTWTHIPPIEYFPSLPSVVYYRQIFWVIFNVHFYWSTGFQLFIICSSPSRFDAKSRQTTFICCLCIYMYMCINLQWSIKAVILSVGYVLYNLHTTHVRTDVDA